MKPYSIQADTPNEAIAALAVLLHGIGEQRIADAAKQSLKRDQQVWAAEGRTYTEIAAMLDQMEARPNTKQE